MGSLEFPSQSDGSRSLCLPLDTRTLLLSYTCAKSRLVQNKNTQATANDFSKTLSPLNKHTRLCS